MIIVRLFIHNWRSNLVLLLLYVFIIWITQWQPNITLRAGAANYDSEKDKLCNEILKGQKNSSKIHRQLLERFCDYFKKSELIKEDTPEGGFPTAGGSDEASPFTPKVYTMENIEAIFDNLKKRSNKFRKDIITRIAGLAHAVLSHHRIKVEQR